MNQRQNVAALSIGDRIGFFGKLPTHGDFVSVGLAASFQNALDQWIQQGLQASENAFGTAWRERFRAMPSWRFVIRGGVWGSATIAGVILASSDRVGRNFPLVIAAELPRFGGDPQLLCYDHTWFTAVEALAESSRARDFELPHFTAGIGRLRLPHSKGDDDEPVRIRQNGRQASIWWMIDPETSRAHGFGTADTPKSSDFVQLLGKASTSPPAAEKSRQEQAPIPVPRSSPAPSHPPVVPPRMVFERSYATHTGTRLTVNADSLLISESPRLFAVADGVANDSAAAEAAKVTINTLTGILVQETLDALVQEIKGKLGRAQGLLQAAPQLPGRDAPQASVVVLGVVDDAFGLVWAGDARCYLVRDGMMRCLTRDHVEVGLRRQLSRSIGGVRQLLPEVLNDGLKDGDRLLLCSAPLTRVLDERAIAETLIGVPIQEAAARLLQDALIANARDNLSAIVVDIRRENKD